MADEIPNAVWANQFDNVHNRKAHYDTTAPEIIAALPEVDAFSCAVGTGGTLAGCSMFFNEFYPHVKVGLTDPKGANLHRYYKDGELKAEGNSITEGIGQGRITANLEGFAPDYNLEIDDETAMEACFELMTKEGLSLGLSSGINVAGAEALARQLGPGRRPLPAAEPSVKSVREAHIGLASMDPHSGAAHVCRFVRTTAHREEPCHHSVRLGVPLY